MKVLIIDDHPLIVAINTDLIANLLPEAEISTITEYAQHAKKSADQYDVVIADLSVDGYAPDAIVAEMEVSFPASKLIFLSGTDASPSLRETIETKGYLFLSKASSYRDVMAAFSAYLGDNAGLLEMAPANGFRSLVQLPGKKPLTIKQAAVMECASVGMTAKEIARELNISPDTARAHLKEAYLRLGAGNKATAVSQYTKAKRLAEAIHGDME